MRCNNLNTRFCWEKTQTRSAGKQRGGRERALCKCIVGQTDGERRKEREAKRGRVVDEQTLYPSTDVYVGWWWWGWMSKDIKKENRGWKRNKPTTSDNIQTKPNQPVNQPTIQSTNHSSLGSDSKQWYNTRGVRLIRSITDVMGGRNQSGRSRRSKAS